MKKKILPFLFALIIVFALTACSSSSPEEIAQKFLNALVAGDIETMENCKLPLSKSQSSAYKEAATGLTNSLFGTNIGSGGMDAIAGSFLAYTYSGYAFKVTGSQIDGDNAKAYFDVYKNGALSSSQEYLPLTRYNGEWYVTLVY